MCTRKIWNETRLKTQVQRKCETDGRRDEEMDDEEDQIKLHGDEEEKSQEITVHVYMYI